MQLLLAEKENAAEGLRHSSPFLWKAIGYIYYKARAGSSQCEVHGAAGRLEQAESRILLWRAEALLGDIYAAQGNDTPKRQARNRAEATIRYIADHAPAELRESFLRSK